MATPAREKNNAMPLYGEIVEGPLAGWRYAFLRFERASGSLPDLVLRCTRPGWPFPQDVRFNMKKDRIKLCAVPGERAPRLDALKLMAIALEHGVATSHLGDRD